MRLIRGVIVCVCVCVPLWTEIHITEKRHYNGDNVVDVSPLAMDYSQKTM